MEAIKGNLDKVRNHQVSGWAYDSSNKGVAIDVALYINERLIKTSKTELLRPKLLSEGRHPTGICGFRFDLKGIGKNAKIQIKAGQSQVEITNSPAFAIENSKLQEQVLIVGLNKSGTSILTYRIAQSLGTENIFFEPEGLRALCDVGIHTEFFNHSSFVTKALFYPRRSDNDLDNIATLYSKRIWIIRDVRDVLISAFFYLWNQSHDQPLSLFEVALEKVRRKEKEPQNHSFFDIASSVYNIEEFCNATFGALAETVKHLDSSWHVIKYEDLVDNKIAGLNSYLGFPVREVEQDNRSTNVLKRVGRTKAYGNWRKWFNREDLQIFQPIFNPILRKLGYDETDWDLRPEHKLSGEDGSEYMVKIYGYQGRQAGNSTRNDSFYPPPEFLNYGSKIGFFNTGDRYMKIFQAMDIQQHHNVLEIGSGLARIGRGFADFLISGKYVGLEIVQKYVDWCNESYRDFETMSFQHLDIKNQYYNKEGALEANTLVFPFDHNSFNLVYLTSVFTHMYRESMENYLRQVFRVLAPGGTILASFFLIDNLIIANMKEGKTKRTFDSLGDQKSYVFNQKNHLAAIAFDKAYILKLFSEIGFSIEKVYTGFWTDKDKTRGSDLFEFNQDTIIATKTI